MLVGDKALEVRGVTEFVPIVRSRRSMTPRLIAVAAGVVVFGAALVLFRPRRVRRTQRRASRPVRLPSPPGL